MFSKKKLSKKLRWNSSKKDSVDPTPLLEERNIVDGSEQPSWLTEDDTSSPVDAFDDDESKTRAVQENPPAEETGDDDGKLPRIIMVMRLVNMAIAVAIVAVSVITMRKFPAISTWVLAIYATFGGLLLCLLETQISMTRNIITMNFGFFFNAVYRFLFNLIMATISWSYGRIYGEAVGITIMVVALFNTYVLCCVPDYRNIREKIVKEEDKKVEAKLTEQARKQALRALSNS